MGDISRIGKRGRRATAVIAAAVLLALAAFAAAEAADPPPDCARVAGKWHMTYSGIGCGRQKEDGTLLLTIRSDCSFRLHRQQIVPFFSTLLFEGKRLEVKGRRISAAVDIEFGGCRKILLSARILDTGEGLRIEGTYRYGKPGTGGEIYGYRMEKY